MPVLGVSSEKFFNYYVMPLNKSGPGQTENVEHQGELCVGWRRRGNRNINFWLRKKREINAIRKSLSSEIVNEKRNLLGTCEDALKKDKAVHLGFPVSEDTSKEGFNYLISNEHSYACKCASGSDGNQQNGEFLKINKNDIPKQLNGDKLSSHPSMTFVNNVENYNNSEWIRINLEHMYSKVSENNCKKGDVKKPVQASNKSSGKKISNDVFSAGNTLLGSSETNHKLTETSNENDNYVTNSDYTVLHHSSQINKNDSSGRLVEKFVDYNLKNKNLANPVKHPTLGDKKEELSDSIKNVNNRISNLRVSRVFNKKISDENISLNLMKCVTPSGKNVIPLLTKFHETLSSTLNLEDCIYSSKKKHPVLSSVLLDHSYVNSSANVVCPLYFSGSTVESNAKNGYIYLKAVDRAVTKKKLVFDNSKKSGRKRSLVKLSSKSLNLKKRRLKKKSFNKKDFSTLTKEKNTNFSKVGFLVIKDTKFDKRRAHKTTFSVNSGKCFTDIRKINSFSEAPRNEDKKSLSNKNAIYHRKEKILSIPIEESMDEKSKLISVSAAKNCLLLDGDLGAGARGLRSTDVVYCSKGANNADENSLIFNECNKNRTEDTQIFYNCSRNGDGIQYEHNYNEVNLVDKMSVHTCLVKGIDVTDSAKVEDWNRKNVILESIKPLTESSITSAVPMFKKQNIFFDEKNCDLESVNPANENHYPGISMNDSRISEGEEFTNDLNADESSIYNISEVSSVQNQFCKSDIEKRTVKLASTEFPSPSSDISFSKIDFDELNNDLELMKIDTQNDTCASNKLDFQVVDFHENTLIKPCISDADNRCNLLDSADLKVDGTDKSKHSNIKNCTNRISSKNLAMNRMFIRNITSRRRRNYLKSENCATGNKNSVKKVIQSKNIESMKKYLKSTELCTEIFKSNCLNVNKIDLNKSKVSDIKLSENLFAKVKQLCPLDCYVRLNRIDNIKSKKENLIVRLNKIENKRPSLLHYSNLYNKLVKNCSILLDNLHPDVVEASESKGKWDVSAGSVVDPSCQPSSSTVIINRDENSSRNEKFCNIFISNKSDVVCYSIVSPLKFSDNHSSVSKTIVVDEMDASNKLSESVCKKNPVVVLSDVVKKLEFLSYFNLQPNWAVVSNDKKKPKSRLCTLNKNYKEQFLKKNHL